MLITEEAIRHWIDNFYGYGSWDARFWLIGYEERAVRYGRKSLTSLIILGAVRWDDTRSVRSTTGCKA